jgi:hypothetical protein
MQTLMELNLVQNQIGEIEALYLADALLTNTVRSVYFDPLNIYLYYCLQTLTTLRLAGNNIDAIGAQYFANVLQINTVR